MIESPSGIVAGDPTAAAASGTSSAKTGSRSETATLMIEAVEFVSQSDGSMLIVADPSQRYSRLDEHQALQLFVWLSNHLRIDAEILKENTALEAALALLKKIEDALSEPDAYCCRCGWEPLYQEVADFLDSHGATKKIP